MFFLLCNPFSGYPFICGVIITLHSAIRLLTAMLLLLKIIMVSVLVRVFVCV